MEEIRTEKPSERDKKFDNYKKKLSEGQALDPYEMVDLHLYMKVIEKTLLEALESDKPRLAKKLNELEELEKRAIEQETKK